MKTLRTATLATLVALFAAPLANAQEAPQLVPPKLVENAAPEYPASNQPAKVVLTLTVDATGAVTDAVVATSGGDDYDAAALAAAKKLVFEPATKSGKPIPAKIPYTFVFEPRPEPKPVVEEKVAGALRGTIRTATNEPLPGATVTIASGGKVLATAITDASGAFGFDGLAPGAVRVHVAADGFAAYDADEEIHGKSVTAVTYRPSPKSDGVEITVAGKRPPREVTVHALEGEEIKKIPGTNGDALRSVENLPGVARPPGLMGMLIVRGSGPADTGVFVDGTSIPIAYHFGGLTSVLPSELLEKIEFYPGNFGTELGRHMGGVVDIRLRSPKKRYGGLVQLDLIDGRFVLEGPISDRTRFIVAGRRSWIDTWLGPMLRNAGAGVTAAPVYYDGQIVLEHDVSATTTARFAAFGSSDRLALIVNSPSGTDPVTGFGLSTRFFRVQGRTETRLSPSAKLTTMVSWGIDANRSEVGDKYVDMAMRPLHARTDVRARVNEFVTVIAGLDVQHTTTTVSLLTPPMPRPGEAPSPFFARPATAMSFDAKWFRPGGYVSLELTPRKNLKLLPGVRADFASDTNEWTVSPRGIGRWDVHPSFPRTTIKGGAGVYHQPPQPYESVAPYGTPGVKANRATHYALGFEQEITRFFDVSVEGFYKSLANLVVQSDAIHARASGAAFTNTGTGRVYGGELLLRYKNDGRFFGWVAYTLSRSERKDSPDAATRTFEYDQTHIFTALGSYKLGAGWEVGARFRYVTGSPYTPFVGGIADLDAGGYAAIPGAPFSARSEAFHRLDMRVEKTWKVGSGSFSAYLDLQNVYNRRNPEGRSYNYNYSKSQPLAGLPILPVIGLRGEL